MNNKPELVCPAGDWSGVTTALENGADSVYFGVKGLSMRNFATNFDLLELKKLMAFIHKKKRKGYLALNTIIKNDEHWKIEKILKEARAASVDAIICWDMSVLAMAKELGLNIHMSTQASIANAQALKMYAGLGAKRAVLARECTLKEIKKIIVEGKKENVNCQVETFIHGAMCISVSGRCFLSYDVFGKSANRGECLQPCRREFAIKDLDQESEYVIGEDYVLSAKDMCSIDFIDDLIKAGIHAFKIEGRMRAPEYLKVVVASYRKAIDSYYEGKLTEKLKRELKSQVTKVYNRGFSTGFFFGQPKDAISKSLGHDHEKIFLGEVRRFYKKIKVADVLLQSGSLQKGETLLFIGKKSSAQSMVVDELQRDHKSIKKAKKGEGIGIKVPFVVKPKDKVFIWRKK